MDKEKVHPHLIICLVYLIKMFSFLQELLWRMRWFNYLPTFPQQFLMSSSGSTETILSGKKPYSYSQNFKLASLQLILWAWPFRLWFDPQPPTNRTTTFLPFLGKSTGNLCNKDSTFLSWLDNHPDKSVIYVAFRSITILSQHQFEELAMGLEALGSYQRFHHWIPQRILWESNG